MKQYAIDLSWESHAGVPDVAVRTLRDIGHRHSGGVADLLVSGRLRRTATPPASTPWLGTPRLLGDRTADDLPA